MPSLTAISPACWIASRSSEEVQARAGRDFPIIVIQEAGLDGSWMHRALVTAGLALGELDFGEGRREARGGPPSEPAHSASVVQCRWKPGRRNAASMAGSA